MPSHSVTLRKAAAIAKGMALRVSRAMAVG